MSSLRIAVRQLLKSPGFTIISLLTLALGIGVNTAMFSVVNTVLFKSAPFPDPTRLVRIFRATPQSQTSTHSPADLADMQAQNTSLASFAWFNQETFSRAAPGQAAERVAGLTVSADFFPTLGVQPALGRGFVNDDFVSGRDHVVVLSHNFWQRRLGGDPAVVGRSLRMDAADITVIGVMPEGVEYPALWGSVDAWRPLVLSGDALHNRRNHWMHAIGRLKDGVALDQARTEFSALGARWAKDFPDTNAVSSFRVIPLHESTIDDVGRKLPWLVFGLTGFVLLIACANLANLQLVRTAVRARDFAVRSALGASRRRLMRELLAENVVLALAGGLLGLGLAQRVTDFIRRDASASADSPLAIVLDARVLVFALLASLVTGMAFGLVPAWIAARTDINAALRRQSRGSTGDRSQHRLRHTLIVAQVGLALVLLAGAGFFIRGLQRFATRDTGWQHDHILIAELNLPDATYGTDEKLRAFYPHLLERLRALPGVQQASLSSELPIGVYANSRGFIPEGPPPPPPAQAPSACHVAVTPDFFRTLQVQLVQGSFFAEDVRADGPRVAIVNETLAREFWPGENPIGQRIGGARADRRNWAEVVGVVRDVGFAGELAAPSTRLQVYLPLVQETWSTLSLALRTSGSAEMLAKTVRQIVTAIDPDLPVHNISTADQTIERRSRNLRLINQLLGGFALLGLGLAALGLYGVISNLVVQRTSEFGLRLALGAQPRDVLRLVLGQGLRLAGLGAALGLVGSLALLQILAALIPALPGQDWLVLAVTVAGTLTLALLACWLPARRATKVDPLTALRAE